MLDDLRYLDCLLSKFQGCARQRFGLGDQRHRRRPQRLAPCRAGPGPTEVPAKSILLHAAATGTIEGDSGSDD